MALAMPSSAPSKFRIAAITNPVLRHLFFSRQPTQYIVGCLHNEPQDALACRTPARHAGSPDPAHLALRTDARPCYCKAYTADLRRAAPGGNRIVIPGVAPAGSERLDRGLLGAFR